MNGTPTAPTRRLDLTYFGETFGINFGANPTDAPADGNIAPQTRATISLSAQRMGVWRPVLWRVRVPDGDASGAFSEAAIR